MAACGLLGGTFDPIHLGHLALAESAREAFHLDEVIFVPAGEPPHKPGQVAAARVDRLRLVEMAVADNPYFAVSRIEVDRPGPSYTIDTVTALRAERPSADWWLIVGSDTLAEIPTWHRYTDLLPLVRLAAAARPGTSLDVPIALQPWLGRIEFFSAPALDISASMIRERIADGRSLRYLVPDRVRAFLATHRLYG